MKFEFSAGGVVYKKDPSAGSGQARIMILVAQHSQHHGWVFPKGLIGDTLKGEKKSASAKGSGETKEEAAVREVKEETGIDAEIQQALEPVTYWYVWEGEKRKKKVYYFVMKYIGGSFEGKDDEMENIAWLPIEEVEERLSFKSDKQIFRQARELIKV